MSECEIRTQLYRSTADILNIHFGADVAPVDQSLEAVMVGHNYTIFEFEEPIKEEHCGLEGGIMPLPRSADSQPMWLLIRNDGKVFRVSDSRAGGVYSIKKNILHYYAPKPDGIPPNLEPIFDHFDVSPQQAKQVHDALLWLVESELHPSRLRGIVHGLLTFREMTHLEWALKGSTLEDRMQHFQVNNPFVAYALFLGIPFLKDHGKLPGQEAATETDSIQGE